MVARRLPAAKPGAGRAARYVSGKMPVTAKNQHRVEASRNSAVKPVSNSNVLPINNREMTEDEKIAAMFQAGDEVWEQQQQQLAKYVTRYVIRTSLDDVKLTPSLVRKLSQEPEDIRSQLVFLTSHCRQATLATAVAKRVSDSIRNG